jgi:membrane protein YqaA with SNARE-associated domain
VFLLIFLSIAQFNWYCTGWSVSVSLFIFLICVVGYVTGSAIGYCVEKPRIDKIYNKEGVKEPTRAQMKSIWNGRHWTTAALGSYLAIRGACFLMFDEYYP